MSVSAGILPFRLVRSGDWEVLLAHPGGPYWQRRDEGWWTIIKGEVDPTEDELVAAQREFEEETGWEPPVGEYLHLGRVRQRAGKEVSGWAVAADLEPSTLSPGTFELEWPPGSGRLITIPEIDRVGWFTPDTARHKLLPTQHPFLERLEVLLCSF